MTQAKNQARLSSGRPNASRRLIDGSYGEGGGQLLRTAVALSALTGIPVGLHSIRARRDPPGLAPQHLAAVRAVAALCSARCEGLALRSTELTFTPAPLRGGEFDFDIGTAGSVVLLLQALLPVMAATQLRYRLTIAGGTDIRAAPPLDYLREVVLSLLARMGGRISLVAHRRGYYPRGGGIVEATSAPADLRPLQLSAPGRLLAISGLAHVAGLPAQIAERMRTSALAPLAGTPVCATCDTAVLGRDVAIGRGGAVVLWAHQERTVLGAGRVAERGTPAETLGTAVGTELAADLACGATVDRHAADQMLIYCALARGESHFLTRELTPHALTAMWLLDQFLPVRFTVSREPGGSRVTVTSEGRP
jgi:RNA 3'-terminal phosphate cyclase (ATP)